MFHAWDWLDLQEAVQDVVFDRLVVECEGRAVGVFPIARSKSWSPKSPVMPFPFLGPLVPPEVLEPTLRAWRRRQWRRGPVLARFDIGPLVAREWQPPLKASGYEVRTLDTVIVDLSHGSQTQLRANYLRKQRQSLTRARREGVQVRRAAPGEVGGLLPALLDEAYTGRGGRSPYPQRTGWLVEEWLRDRDDAVALTALLDGEPAGLIVVLGGRPTAVGWVGGCFRRHRQTSANVLLYHEGLRWALEKGCSRLDLCASLDEGVRRYKLGFGGHELPGLRVDSIVLPAQARRLARAIRETRR